MWNERQRTQKIGFELERVKHGLREQHLELGELMRVHGVTQQDLVLLQKELNSAAPAERAIPVGPVSSNARIVRG